MLLDIGIPCFNESKYLQKCLESIDQHFKDNYQDIKVWVIDDDSMYSDEYQEIITHFNHHFTIQYIKMEKNSGPGPCRNVVFDKGTAPWIIFIDDDDIFINNPIRNFNTQDSSINLIKTIVTDGQGKMYAELDSFWTGCWGIVFNRNYLLEHNLKFTEDLGVIGTEDSVFLTFALACAKKVVSMTSFVVHQVRDDSQYSLKSSSIIHCGASLLYLCNIYAGLLKYKNHIQNFTIIWKAIKQQYQNFLRTNNIPPISTHEHMYNYYLILFYLVVFKIIRLAFPTSEDIKKILTQEDKEFLPLVYCAYHFCNNVDDDVLYYNYKAQPFLTIHNFVPELCNEDMFYTLHFSSVYQGLIQYPGLKLIKDNRRKKGLPEKYWNF